MKAIYSFILGSLLYYPLFAKNPVLDSANLYFERGNFARALELTESAYSEWHKTIPAFSEESAMTVSLMAEINYSLMNCRDARKYYLELLGMIQQARGINYRYVDEAKSYADMLADDGEYQHMDSLMANTARSCRSKNQVYTLQEYQVKLFLEHHLETKASQINDSLDHQFDYYIDEYDNNEDTTWLLTRPELKEWMRAQAVKKLNEYNGKKKKEDPELAVLLMDIGMKYDSLDFYPEADSVFDYCDRFASMHFGPYNDYSVQSKVNRAGIRKSRGDYMGAFDIIKSAEPVARVTYGSESGLYGDILRTMAGYLKFLGRKEEALALYKKVLAIFQSQISLVNNHYSGLILDMSNVTDITGLLGDVIHATEARGVYCNNCYSYLLEVQARELEKKMKIEEAEALYFKALDNLPESDKEGVSEIEVALADFYVRCRAQGLAGRLQHFGTTELLELNGKREWKFIVRDSINPYYNERLESIYEDAIKKAIDKHGSLHPSVADLRLSEALLYWGWKPQFETILEFNKALKSYLDITHSVFPYLTEAERIRFYNSNRKALESFMAFLVSEKMENPMVEASSFAYDSMESLKRLIGDDTVNFRIRKSTDRKYYLPDYTAPGILLNYRLITKGLIYQSVSGVKNWILQSKDSELISIYNSWQALRERVAQREADKTTRPEEAGKADSLSAAADSLERWLSVRSRDFGAREVNEQVTWKDLLRSMNSGDIAIEVIKCHPPMYYRTLLPGYDDSVYYGYLILSPVMRGTVAMIIQTNGKGLETKDYQYYANSIRYRQTDTLSEGWYWKPVETALKNLGAYGKIYFSPDGVYNKINLNTLQWPDGQYLIDRYDLHQLSNLREMILMKNAEGSSNRNSILIGNPDFGNKTAGEKTDTLKERSVDFTHLLQHGLESLPGTGKELRLIGNTLIADGWKVSEYEGSEASESNLKRVHEPGILHIATHGFFNDDLGNGNPLFNCGILLSEIGEPALTGKEDGIFTGYEALNLDLQGCRMVVLSACESGLGKIESGEGVYGLQRAFREAGAGATLMSLWKVNDAATQELMSAFYKSLGEGQGLSFAFKSAQLLVRKKFPQPYYWGAFVLTGM